ncbi:flagellar biosynthesis protein FlhF [Candidatus Sumerlaeota bacterium]|nr:flagellar biosynthesis protein FlhF [Candidatus Sumerlaeota bacterium]
MFIRKFIGTTIADALSQVKRELGADAVILQSRKFRPGNEQIQRCTQPLTEITAAIDYHPAPRPARRELKNSGALIQEQTKGITPEMRRNIEAILTRVNAEKAEAEQEIAQQAEEQTHSTTATAIAERPDEDDNENEDFQDMLEISNHSTNLTIEPQQISDQQEPVVEQSGNRASNHVNHDLLASFDISSPSSSYNSRSERIEDLMNTIRKSNLSQPREPWERAKKALKSHLESMQRQGASEDLLNWLAELADADLPYPDDPIHFADWLKPALAQRINCQPHAEEKKSQKSAKSEPFVCALCGPTGVGKTTTLAKLAARRVSKGQRVGLITLDTFRVAAAEQLAVYARIMHLPLKVVRNEDELGAAMQSLNDMDAILIDTAGHSQRQLDRLEEQMAILRQIQARLTLCLNLTIDAQVRQDVLGVYRSFGASEVILTKKDETYVPLCVTNAAFECQIPVAYITDGQRVPEDIHPANISHFIDL